MARSPRLVVPGMPLHITQRGNNRTATFQSADDFERYHEALFHSSRCFECAIHAYVLMTNHVHLLITPEDERGPSCMMQTIGRRYVRSVNARYDRTGTLWEGRFKSALVNSERYLFACHRYIELNPVRARMVHDPNQYRWSSHRHNASGHADALVTPHALYQALGSSRADRQAAYRGLFQAATEPETLDGIRSATNRGAVLGDADFREHVARLLGRRVGRVSHGGDRRSAAFHEGTHSFSTTLTP